MINDFGSGSDSASGSGSGSGPFTLSFGVRPIDPLPVRRASNSNMPNYTPSLPNIHTAAQALCEQLGYMTLSFFLLSALFHGVVVITSLPIVRRWRKPSFLFGYYFTNLNNCGNVWRWVEYSFSASIMIVVIAITSFIRNVYTVWGLFTLCWCSMVFGYA